MRQRIRRPAVTLVEVLVVIAILAVLFGLIMAIIQSSRDAGIRLQTRNEIQRLDGKLREFALAKRCYPPSQIRLCETYQEYDLTNLVDIRSLEIIQQVFGKDVWKYEPIDWDGDGIKSPPVMLTGDQCLVFFLGGIPEQSTPGVRGFASGGNPAARRGAPLFNFDRHRLVKVRGNNFYSIWTRTASNPTRISAVRS
jgi:prepilin-type N-terminal cleavage/methylation domain-containing protein